MVEDVKSQTELKSYSLSKSKLAIWSLLCGKNFYSGCLLEWFCRVLPRAMEIQRQCFCCHRFRLESFVLFQASELLAPSLSRRFLYKGMLVYVVRRLEFLSQGLFSWSALRNARFRSFVFLIPYFRILPAWNSSNWLPCLWMIWCYYLDFRRLLFPKLSYGAQKESPQQGVTTVQDTLISRWFWTPSVHSVNESLLRPETCMCRSVLFLAFACCVHL